MKELDLWTSKDVTGGYDIGCGDIALAHVLPVETFSAALRQRLPEGYDPRTFALLFKAAPKMLEALRWFVEFCDEHPEWTEVELCNGTEDSAEACWLRSVRDVVSRAEGKEA